jgi:hypothetical protein
LKLARNLALSYGGAKRGRPVGSPARDREAVGEVFVNGIRLKYIHNVYISFLLDDYFAMRSDFPSISIQ